MTRPAPTRLEWWLAYTAAAVALVAWSFWYHAGLVLSHYDAKAHLVVARRVFDSLTPGWQQIGAVWLPLPHLLNLLPTQIDILYRTGIFASALSIGCFAVTVWAVARLIRNATGSSLGMFTGAVLLILNPNLLYLHATPLTEPLLIATTFLLVVWLHEWLATDPPVRIPRKLDAVLFAATWTRYEAWLAIAGAFALVAWVRWRHGDDARRVVAIVARLSAWPAVALILFLVDSRITVGQWFVTGGFYVPDPAYEGLVGRSLLAVWWGTHRLSGYVLELTALITAAWLLLQPARNILVTIALLMPGALPFYALTQGHPFRIRYMIPLVAAGALFSGLAVGFLDRKHADGTEDAVLPGRAGPSDHARRAVGTARHGRMAGALLAVVLLVGTLIESPPWLGRLAPLIEESTWDLPASAERRTVTSCLAPAYRGERVLASMGSLAHYMQELSRDGFRIADFIHEGNGTIWNLALRTGPAPHAGWMLVEERAEGGDVLAQRIRNDPSFVRGMSRVCEGGGVALYRRNQPPNRMPIVAR